jgi:tRNA(His) 5'-end guanylyltransferase
MTSLRERQEEYESKYDSLIIKRLPIVIRAELRNLKRLTQNLSKPYCSEFSDIMANSMLYTIVEIQDAVFGFQHGGEITFVLRNDKSLEHEPWYQNNIQKIVSTVSGLLTAGFYRYVDIIDVDEDINLVGDAIFHAKAFGLPYIAEVVNNLIWRQQLGIRKAISEAAFVELEDKFGRRTAAKILNGKSDEEKSELLLRHCGINFYEYYPLALYRGIAAYKVPKIVPTRGGSVTRNKWTLNDNIPSFVEDKDFVSNILINGLDVFRAPDVSGDMRG